MKKIIILLVSTIFILTINTNAQTKDSQPCPAIILKGLIGNKIIEGQSAMFEVKPFEKKYDDIYPTYNWSSTNGTIISGQGTSMIYIDTRNLKGQMITVTLELGGMPKGCSITKSSTIKVVGQKMKAETKGKSIKAHTK